jgi:peptide/nickel transport system ATP-binding protein
MFKADHVLGMMRDEYFPGISAADWTSKVEGSLKSVSLNPGQVLNKYPHQLSGGQLQRLLIARALLLEIEILVADEIISMLDASTRIDVVNLLGDLKARGLGILFITHDLSLGNYISERTVILRQGRIVEMGATPAVFGRPLHPYTRMLIESVPQIHQKWEQIEVGVGAAMGWAPATTEPCLYHAARPGSGTKAAPDGERQDRHRQEGQREAQSNKPEGTGSDLLFRFEAAGQGLRLDRRLPTEGLVGDRYPMPRGRCNLT